MTTKVYQIYETVHNEETGRTEEFYSAMFACVRLNQLQKESDEHTLWHMREAEIEEEE